MIFTSDDWWIIATLSIVATNCALVGSFLLLQKNSLMGDAISHAVLPGLPLAYLLTQSRSMSAMLLGALFTGLLAVFSISALERFLSISHDAALGLVFTTFFSIGVILISQLAGGIHLDLDCVLFGAAEHIPFVTIDLFGVAVPKATLITLLSSLILIAMLIYCHKAIVGIAFDSAFAKALGLPVGTIQWIFLSITSLIIVTSFESLGAITIVSLLAAPAASAFLLTRKVVTMCLVSVLIGILSAISGYLVAYQLNISAAGPAGAISLLIFCVVLVVSPRYGLLRALYDTLRVRLTIIEEDVLGTLFRSDERTAGASLSWSDLSSRTGSRFLLIRALIGLLIRRRISVHGLSSFSLTDSGKRYALQIVRSHRLWESYLARNTTLPLDHLHASSERVEHFLPTALTEQLAEELGNKLDPHGKPIPEKTAD